MKTPACIFTLLTCLGFATLGTPGLQAQTVSPAPTPTMITTAPFTITSRGYYQLGADLSSNGVGLDYTGIVTIQANNVTLDLGGHFISGPPSTPGTKVLGVYANGFTNIKILNGTIANCYEGIKLDGTNSNSYNHVLQNLLLTFNYGFGVYLPQSLSVDILDCRISSIGGTTLINNAYGIFCNGSTGVRISDCVITNVTAGSGGTAYGIDGGSTTFSRRNNISNCPTGISGGKYQDTLTSGCTTSVTGGTDAGGNF